MKLKMCLFMFVMMFSLICTTYVANAERDYGNTATNGVYIYRAEGGSIYRYNMNGTGKTAIYSGSKYGYDIVGLFGRYLYITEYHAVHDGLGTPCSLKIINIYDKSVKKVTDFNSRVSCYGTNVFIQPGERGDYSKTSLYCASIDGSNLKLISNKSNGLYTIRNNQLYYLEMDYPNGYYSMKHRLLKSNLNGSNPTVVYDWFNSLTADVFPYGMTYSTSYDNSYIKYFSNNSVKEYSDNHYIQEIYSNNGTYYYINDDSYYSDKYDSFVFYKVKSDNYFEQVADFNKWSDNVCFLSIIDGVLYYMTGDNINIKSTRLDNSVQSAASVSNVSATTNSPSFNTVTASSQLGNQGKYNYSPYNLIDNNIQTAWVEGVSGKGEGQWVMLSSNSVQTIHKISICNGYRQNNTVYAQNGKVTKAKIEFSDGTSVIADLSLNQLYTDINVGEKKTSYIKITLLSCVNGSKYDDICISEIKVS